MSKIFKNIFLFVVPVLVASTIIFENNKELGLKNNFILIILVILIFFTILAYMKRFNQTDYFPIFVMSNIYIFVCYLGLFFFNKYKIFSRFNSTDYTYALNILFYSYIFYFLGYFTIKILSKNFSRKEIIKLNSSLNEILILGILCLSGIICFYYFINIQNYFGFLAQIKYPLLLFGYGLLITYISLEKKSNTIYFKVFCSLLICIPLIIELTSGAFSFPFVVIFLTYIYYCLIKKKIIITPLLILFFVFLLFHVGKYDLRKNLEVIKGSNISNLNMFYSTYKKIFLDRDNYNKEIECINRGYSILFNYGEKNIECTLTRGLSVERRLFHSMESLLIVTTSSPKEIPFWNGYSYKILSTKLIPRALWKDKPSDRLGNEFGRRYNVLTKKDEKYGYEDDFTTSWNMPIINEFFVNFGIKGSILGAFLLGLIIGLIEKLFTIKNNYNLEKILSFFLFAPLFLMESHLSLMVGALIQSYIFLVIVSFIFLFLKRKIIK